MDEERQPLLDDRVQSYSADDNLRKSDDQVQTVVAVVGDEEDVVKPPSVRMAQIVRACQISRFSRIMTSLAGDPPWCRDFLSGHGWDDCRVFIRVHRQRA